MYIDPRCKRPYLHTEDFEIDWKGGNWIGSVRIYLTGPKKTHNQLACPDCGQYAIAEPIEVDA